MKSLQYFGAFLALILSAVSADDVLVLDDKNFATEINNHEVLLVEFYAPWCGHCKQLEPEYSAAAKVLVDTDPPIHIAKVDCIGDGKQTCEKFSVSGFPTIKLFRNGEFSAEYDGERSKDGIVKYMRTKAGPVSKVLTTVSEVELFTSNKLYPVAVGFFKTEDSDLYRQFLGVAGQTDGEFKFAHTLNEDVMKKFKYTDQVVIFRPTELKTKTEEQIAVYESGDMKQWFDKNVFGLLGVRSVGNGRYFPTPLVTVYYNVDYVRDPKGTQYWRNRIIKVAKDFPALTFCVALNREMGIEMREFNMLSSKPVQANIKDDKGRKFVMDVSEHDFTVDSFRKFVQEFVDDKLEPVLKSEPLPVGNTGPVRTVVAKTFNEIVNDKTKDVLIEFYAPWCGHCKNLEPKFQELGVELEKEDDVLIAKMDATANDIPAPYSVSGYPTIYFAPKNAKDAPKKYTGGREVKDFLQYLAKESTLKGFDKKGNKRDEL